MAQATALLTVVCVVCTGFTFCHSKRPVVLVPGKGGCQLWHKYDSKDKFTGVWLYPYEFVFHFNKIFDQLTLHFDALSGTTTGVPHETIEACGFGGLDVLTSLVISWNLTPIGKPKISQAECDGTQAMKFTNVKFDLRSFDDGMRFGALMLANMIVFTSAPNSSCQCYPGKNQTLGPNWHNGVRFDLRSFNDSIVFMEDVIGNIKVLMPKPNAGCQCFLCDNQTDFPADDNQHCVDLETIVKIFEEMKEAWKDLHYYKEMVHMLEKQGFVAHEDLLGAPYDFRKSPSELNVFYNKLMRLIEDAYSKNGNSSVVVVAHSYGNPVMLHFYNNFTTQAWRDRFIHAHVALAPPWAGAVKTTGMVVSGKTLGLPTTFFRGDRLNKLRATQRSWPSSIWLMPCVLCGVWDPKQPVVVTATRNYSVNEADYQQLFQDLNFPEGAQMWHWLQRDAPADLSKLPGVRQLHVWYGTGVDTPSQIVFKGREFPNGDHNVEETKAGDGTVNLISLEAFKHVTPPPNMTVSHTALQGVNHMGIIRDPRVLDFIVNIAK